MALDRDRTAVVVVDVQEGFRPVIAGFDEMVGSIETLLRGVRVMGIPAIVTEQYPRGLGSTVAEISALLTDVTPLEKTVFAATDAEGFDLNGRDQVLLCGIETHICVYQTAAALLAQGLEVQIVEDAVSSRTAANHEVGIGRIAALGGARTSVEMALFELLGKAGTPEFKAVQQLVK